MAMPTRASGRLNMPPGSHFAKRDAQGWFKAMDNVGRSLAADRRTKPKRSVKSGDGDQGSETPMTLRG